MSDHFYKDKLYPFQDKVLRKIGTHTTSFYLTGGTVLGRFLLHHRYSDDLDFFVNDDSDFVGKTDALMNNLSQSFSDIRSSTQQDSFARYFIVENDVHLKVEFINDVRFRVGTTTSNEMGINLDTWDNILSNKLTALSRGEGKDFVDVLFLSLKYPFSWEVMIDYAKEKDGWVNELNISQHFLNFDLEKLREVKFPEGFEKEKITKGHFAILAKESLHGYENSLAGKDF